MRRSLLLLALACTVPCVLVANRAGENRDTAQPGRTSDKYHPSYAASEADTNKATPDMSPEAQMAQKVLRGMRRGLDLATRGCGCGRPPQPRDAGAKCGCGRPRPKDPDAKCGCGRPPRPKDTGDKCCGRPRPRPKRHEVSVCETCDGDILPDGVERCLECDGDICTVEDAAKCCGRPKPRPKCGCSRPKPRPKCGCSKPRPRPVRSEEDEVPVCDICNGDVLPDGVERCLECDGDVCTIDSDAAKGCSCGCSSCSCSKPCGCCKSGEEETDKCCGRPKPRPKCGCSKPKPRPKCGCSRPKPRPKCGDDVCTVDPAA